MNILVTGGAGFIGSHTCKALAQWGYIPITYDNLSRGHRHAVKWGPLEIGDIANVDRIREVIEKYRPVALMHFAAFINVGESVVTPLNYYLNNTAGSATLLKTMLEIGPLPFVFSSTAAIYGMPIATPIEEDHPLRPINPYGWSKLFVERMLIDAESSQRLPWVALRYFNAAGADSDGEVGEQHDPETHVIPLVIESALTRKAFKIFGTNYDTPDGTCVRDYVHVMDIADAHVRALKYLLAGGKSVALNLANALGYSVKEVIATAESICGDAIPVIMAARRPGDPAILVGSAHRARDILGWVPTRSKLEIQIRDAWNWFSSRTPIAISS